MADIIKIAEQLNSDVTRLNNERSKLEGILESAKTNYDRAVKAYETKYGVKLSEETIQEEYNKVFARTKGAILDLQEKIEGIKRGDYKQNEGEIEYDLEPNVLPIREEAEPKKKKGTRKSKKDKPETPIEEIPTDNKIGEQAEEIEEKVEEKVEIPVEENLFNMNLDFGGFPDNTTIEVPKEEKKVVVKDVKTGKKGKPLSGSDLSAAVAAADIVKQNPVTFPDLEDEDEVDISNVVNKESKEENKLTEDFGFGSFGDLVSSETQEKKEESKNMNKSQEISGFGSFGDFGGFGDLGSSQDEEESDEVDLGGSDNSVSFGGLGDLGIEAEEIEEEPNEKKNEPLAPEGWGSEVNFGDFGDLGSFGDFGNFKI